MRLLYAVHAWSFGVGMMHTPKMDRVHIRAKHGFGNRVSKGYKFDILIPLNCCFQNGVR